MGGFFRRKTLVFHPMMKNSRSKMAEYTKSRFEKGFIHSFAFKIGKESKGKISKWREGNFRRIRAGNYTRNERD